MDGSSGPTRFLANGDRPLEQRLRVRVTRFRAVEFAQIVQHGCDFRMIRTERLLPDRQRALVQRLGHGVLAQIVVDRAQVIQRHRDVGVIGAKLLLAQGQSLLGEWQRFRVLAGPIKLFHLQGERARLILSRIGRRTERQAQRERGDRNTDRCFQGLHRAFLRRICQGRTLLVRLEAEQVQCGVDVAGRM